jgi:hypothetical protein
MSGRAVAAAGEPPEDHAEALPCRPHEPNRSWQTGFNVHRKWPRSPASRATGISAAGVPLACRSSSPIATMMRSHLSAPSLSLLRGIFSTISRAFAMASSPAARHARQARRSRSSPVRLLPRLRRCYRYDLGRVISRANSIWIAALSLPSAGALPDRRDGAGGVSILRQPAH